jgi:hypothetical protein
MRDTSIYALIEIPDLHQPNKKSFSHKAHSPAPNVRIMVKMLVSRGDQQQWELVLAILSVFVSREVKAPIYVQKSERTVPDE